MQTPYNKPVKKLLAEYLANRPPPAAFIWLNLYLEKIRSKIISMDNLLHKFVTPEGQDVYVGTKVGTVPVPELGRSPVPVPELGEFVPV